MVLLTAEQILGTPDLNTEDVDVPEWGGMVRVRSLSGTERDQLEVIVTSANKAGGKGANVRAWIAAMSIVDDDGRRLFTDKQIVALGTKSGAALDRVFEVAKRISRLTKDDIKQLEGNSEADQSGDSGSS